MLPELRRPSCLPGGSTLAREHPDPGHEPRLGIALDQEDLEAPLGVLSPSPQQDHGCCRSRLGRLHAPPAYSLHSRLMATETTTKQLYICTSCGFIYDPAEGDPDGGVPPGTAFEDIPDDWFCPVCGARKSDFEPYEE